MMKGVGKEGEEGKRRRQQQLQSMRGSRTKRQGSEGCCRVPRISMNPSVSDQHEHLCFKDSFNYAVSKV